MFPQLRSLALFLTKLSMLYSGLYAMNPDIRLRLRDEAMLALLAYAGLRVQEVCDVQLRDIDLEGGTVTIRSGKGGKARRLPLHSDAQRMLRRYLKEYPAAHPASHL